MADDPREGAEEAGGRPEEAPDDDGRDAEDEDEGEDAGRRPIPVSDLMPSAPSRPARRAPKREGKGRDEEDAPGEEEEEESEGGPGSPAVPTPVRVAMDAAPPGDSRPVEALPSREFEVEGRTWVVRVTGRTVTGSRPDPGALLMSLEFFDPDDPDRPLRRLLTVDRSLEALYPEDLGEMLERARPVEEGNGG